MEKLLVISVGVLLCSFVVRTTITNVDKVHQEYKNSELFEPDLKTGTPKGDNSSNIFIFPETKWCGEGNKASSYDDLGKATKTDRCCRTHDHCPYYLNRWEHKFNTFNKYPWTVSHCNCDIALFECLKDANTEISNMVGESFFGALTVHCITFETGRYCADESWTHSCKTYANGPHAVMHHPNLTWSLESIIG